MQWNAHEAPFVPSHLLRSVRTSRLYCVFGAEEDPTRRRFVLRHVLRLHVSTCTTFASRTTSICVDGMASITTRPCSSPSSPSHVRRTTFAF